MIKENNKSIAQIKQESRDEDQNKLDSGGMTREELSKQNYIFYGCKVKIISHPKLRKKNKMSIDKKYIDIFNNYYIEYNIRNYDTFQSHRLSNIDRYSESDNYILSLSNLVYKNNESKLCITYTKKCNNIIGAGSSYFFSDFFKFCSTSIGTTYKELYNHFLSHKNYQLILLLE